MATERSIALLAAIQTVLHDNADDYAADRGLVTDYVVIVEMLGDDGETYMRMFQHPQTGPWRTLGLLDGALTQARCDFTAVDEDNE